MYGEHPLQDTVRALRACATNQVARFAPRAYIEATAQTGRGEANAETVAGIVAYFKRCFFDYFEVLGVPPDDIAEHLRGKTLLEYGPGDTPGVALLMYAHGARKIFCVDRFPLLTLKGRNAEVLKVLINDLPPELQARGRAALRLDHEGGVGLRRECVECLVRPSGLSGLRGDIDLAYSRAVLEHVDDLQATFVDMAGALRPSGIAIHQVDLKSHGLHRRNPLDFLSWPQSLWHLMYSHKGVPNRWRVNRYREALAAARLRARVLSPTASADARDVAEMRPHLAAPFRYVSDEDLAWLGFWLVCEK